jgi:hypothetical protein
VLLSWHLVLHPSHAQVQKKAVRRTNDDEEYELYPEEDEKEPASESVSQWGWVTKSGSQLGQGVC